MISEKEYIKSGYRHIAEIISEQNRLNKELGDKHLIYEVLIQLFDASPKNVFNRLLDKLEVPYTKDDILDLVKAYREHKPNIQFYPDVLPCLEQLKKRGIKTGIITDGYVSTQKNKLIALGADRYFNFIIVTDELGREYWKPDPRAFEIMRDKLEVSFDEMIYIGDNPEKDFYIGSIFPIQTVRLVRISDEHNHIYIDKDYLKGIKEQYRIFDLYDLFKLF